VRVNPTITPKVPPLRVNPILNQMKQHEEEAFEEESCYLLHSSLDK